jgi:sugar phosphate isomerase/epimerase
MKYGITISTMTTERRPATFGDGRFTAHLPGIRALGYHGVDLFIKPEPEAEIHTYREALRENDLEISVIFPILLFESGLFLSDPDRDRRAEAVRVYKTQIDLAEYLGASIVLGLCRGEPEEGESESSYQDRLAGSLTELADYAGERGVVIVMEPIHRFLISTFHRADQCLQFFDRYDLHSIMLLLDTFHMNIEERSIEEAIRLAGNRIGHVHAVDSNRGAPGDGHLDFKSIIGTLVESGYDRYLSVETQPQEKPYDCAERGIGVLRSIVENTRGPGGSR